MTVVFISGSRTIPCLPLEVQARVDNMIDKGLHIVVGDSERGVDSRIVSYLCERRYSNVSIYSIHSTCRIKQLLPSWTFRKITPGVPAREDKNGKVTNRRKLETFKDRAMCDLCDFALVIWQDTYTDHRFGRRSVSAGSLRNSVQLLLDQKPVTMYHKSEDDILGDHFTHHEFRSIRDLETFVEGLDALVQDRFSKIVKEEAQNAADLLAMEQQHFDL